MAAEPTEEGGAGEASSRAIGVSESARHAGFPGAVATVAAAAGAGTSGEAMLGEAAPDEGTPSKAASPRATAATSAGVATCGTSAGAGRMSARTDVALIAGGVT